jgi:hypothetical protein
MATTKQRAAARKNVKKAQAGGRRKKTITSLSIEGRSRMGKAQLIRAVGQKRRSSR